MTWDEFMTGIRDDDLMRRRTDARRSYLLEETTAQWRVRSAATSHIVYVGAEEDAAMVCAILEEGACQQEKVADMHA